MGKLKAGLKTYGDDVRIFMALNTFDELSNGEDYSVDIRVVMKTEARQDDFRE